MITNDEIKEKLINDLERESMKLYFRKELTSKEKGEEWNDMQGLITRGYRRLLYATYLMIKIEREDVEAAKLYFNDLIKCITTEGKIRREAFDKNQNVHGDPDEAVQIAFSAKGLEKLGVIDKVLKTFSREFLEGMSPCDSGPDGERATILGDCKKSKAENWHWGNSVKPVDCMLMLFAKNKKGLDDLILKVFTNLPMSVTVVYTADTLPLSEKESDKELKEHFGFRDGMSQPIIKGFSKSGNLDINESHLINAGEFILGHKNQYNNYSPGPYVAENDGSPEYAALPDRRGNVKNLGLNGTYLVFRQMEQHVEKFWNFLYNHSREDGLTKAEKAVNLAAKMVGRFPNGDPLVQTPGTCPFNKELLNNFGYAKSDKDGVQCPLGAHIRRTNPRDQVHAGRNEKDSLEMTKTHRLLRRGRIYGEPLDEDFDINKMIANSISHNPNETNETEDENKPIEIKRGLHFICPVSDIARQFEFVQNVWANTPTFANLVNEVDPIISNRSVKGLPACDEFTVPKENVRNRYKEVPEFTTVVGGEYFFMPNIRALKYILK